MQFMWPPLLSERGEDFEKRLLAQEIINCYWEMNTRSGLHFSEMVCRDLLRPIRFPYLAPRGLSEINGDPFQ